MQWKSLFLQHLSETISLMLWYVFICTEGVKISWHLSVTEGTQEWSLVFQGKSWSHWKPTQLQWITVCRLTSSYRIMECLCMNRLLLLVWLKPEAMADRFHDMTSPDTCPSWKIWGFRFQKEKYDYFNHITTCKGICPFQTRNWTQIFTSTKWVCHHGTEWLLWWLLSSGMWHCGVW
jgi:hypothetical protein